MTSQEMERAVAAALVDKALRDGHSITVNDGVEIVIRKSKDRATILGAMFSTSEDFLYFFKGEERAGWAHLIYGNGWDVLSDWSVNAGRIAEDALALSDRFIEESIERP